MRIQPKFGRSIGEVLELDLIKSSGLLHLLVFLLFLLRVLS